MGSSPSAFKNLYKIYVVAMTLACTRVNCERAFSKLKIIKTRLRAAINQEYLEALMLLSIESDLIPSSDETINLLGESSNELSRLLLFQSI